MALLSEMASLAEILGVALWICCALVIPHSIRALVIYEHDTRVKQVHRDKDFRFWPSLYVTTWLTRSSLIGMVVMIGTWTTRLLLKFETVAINAATQPDWSLVLGAIAGLVIVVIFAMPAYFLIWVKKQIMRRAYIPRNGYGEHTSPDGSTDV